MLRAKNIEIGKLLRNYSKNNTAQFFSWGREREAWARDRGFDFRSGRSQAAVAT